MQTPGTESAQEEKTSNTCLGVLLGIVLIPVLIVGVCLAIPVKFVIGWMRQHREHKLRSLMKSRGRLITWQEFLRSMRESGGTCIEEKFSPKGPVRLWWTPDNLHDKSPHEIIYWFTMRKGFRGQLFVHWCREHYTNAEAGSAVLVDTWGATRKEIYALWSRCHSETSAARWVEVAPPEILPRRPGQ